MPPRRKAPAAKTKASTAKAASPVESTPPPSHPQGGEPSAVAALFNRAQEAGTAAAAKRLADLLWGAWARQAHENSNDDDAFWLELERCVSHLLVNAPQVRLERAREREGGGGNARGETRLFGRRRRRIEISSSFLDARYALSRV